MSNALAASHAVVFDLDGTLVDSRRDIAASANYALQVHGYPTLPEEEIAGYVGDGARRLVQRAAKLESRSPEVEALLATFVNYYTAHAADHTRPIAGAEATLDALKPLPIALCTNKPRETTNALLHALGWHRRFDLVVAGGDFPAPKPDPLPLLHISSTLGVAPQALVMIGDGPQDVECGRAVGCRTVGIIGGLIPRDRLLGARPDFLIEHLDELPALLESLGISADVPAPPALP